MQTTAVADSMRQFIFEHFPPARHRALRDTDPLIATGIVDSMSMLDVVGFIESEFNIRVEDEDLTAENFQSISSIVAFIEGKQAIAG